MVTLHYNYLHICNGMPDGMFYKSIIFIFTYPSQKESKESILSYLFLIIVIIYFVNHALNLPQGLPLLFYSVVHFSNMIHFSKDGHGWTNKQTCFFLSPPVSRVRIYSVHINLWLQQSKLWPWSLRPFRPLRVGLCPRPSVRRINGRLIIDQAEQIASWLNTVQLQT